MQLSFLHPNLEPIEKKKGKMEINISSFADK